VGNLGMWEILVILLVVLLLFGAKRLPEVGSSIGKGIREFKRSISDTQDAIMSTDEQRQNPSPRLPDAQAPKPSPTAGEPKRLSQ
jgi:sec-independent protein translocase protein TatA